MFTTLQFAELKKLILTAGAIARDHQRSGRMMQLKKSDGSKLTSGDVMVNNFLVQSIRTSALLGGCQILSEEQVMFDGHYDANMPTIVLDPIDGTAYYADYKANYYVMAGVVQQGIATHGIIYSPERDIVVTGDVAQQCAELAVGGYTVPLPINNYSPHTANCIQTQQPMWDDVETRKRIEQFACGREVLVVPRTADALSVLMGVTQAEYLDYRVYPGLTKYWDFIPQSAILRAAGGCVYALDGTTPMQFPLTATVANDGYRIPGVILCGAMAHQAIQARCAIEAA